MTEATVLALVSVIASSCVAATATCAQYKSAALARKHERDKDLLARTWQARADMLLELAAWAARMQRLLQFEERRDLEAALTELRDMVHRLDTELLGAVELYASTETRASIGAARRELGELNLMDHEVWSELLTVYRDKCRFIDVQDYESSASARDRERDLLRKVGLPDGAGEVGNISASMSAVLAALRADVS